MLTILTNDKVLKLLKIVLIILVGAIVSFILRDYILRSWEWVRNKFLSVGASISNENALSISTSLLDEINDPFTDEDVIVNTLIPLSLADYYKVKAEFGLQRYLPLTDDFGPLGSLRNLTEILNHTLSNDDKQKIKTQNPKLPIG
ncbi:MULTISPECIES: hypothetical protein [Galbibacter]|uniref:hypothetical protein n=1 Tax=Galbibacter orientalis TaxID=453852 RepID=UPI003001BF73